MVAPLPPYVEPLGHGVYAIDTGFYRERFDAAYLLVEAGRAAFIDTGTNFALPRLLGALQALELSPEAVDAVIPTHVHLDHAGGAGELMRHLPTAKMYVHPRGARHMIDPQALYQGALAVYGQAEMDRSYGQLVPVAAERVVAMADGARLEIGGRALTFADTPGHARHHHCIWDERCGGWFTGDTFGLSYREFDTARGAWLMPTTTPVQFEPDALRKSIERLLAASPQAVYLTHFGRVQGVQGVQEAGAQLLGLLDRTVTLGLACRGAADRPQRLAQGLMEIYLQSLQDHGCTLPAEQVRELLMLDVGLNVQGMEVWLGRT